MEANLHRKIRIFYLPLKLAETVAPALNRDIEGNVDVLRQDDIDTTGYLEWVCTFATDALIELIQARLEEEKHPEGCNDVHVTPAAVTCNQQSRLLH